MAWMDSRRTGSLSHPLARSLAHETGPCARARTPEPEHAPAPAPAPGASRHATLLVLTVLAGLWPAAAQARDRNDGNVRWFQGFPSWTIEVYAGVADHGRLLLQALDDDVIVDGIIVDGILLPERVRITPYAGLSFALAWWNLDDEDPDPIVAGDDDTLIMGEESFVTTSGLTIDGPTHIRQTNFRLVIAYTFGGPGRRATK